MSDTSTPTSTPLGPLLGVLDDAGQHAIQQAPSTPAPGPSSPDPTRPDPLTTPRLASDTLINRTPDPRIDYLLETSRIMIRDGWEREELIAELRARGHALRRIGKAFGITGQRVHQILEDRRRRYDARGRDALERARRDRRARAHRRLDQYLTIAEWFAGPGASLFTEEDQTR